MENTILDDNFAEKTNPLENVRFASFGDRLGAALIDFLILLPLTIVGFLQFYEYQIASFDGYRFCTGFFV